MKKIVLVFVMLFTLILPSFADASGFSGGSSSRHSSFTHSTYSNSSTYHSGYKKPSSNVSRNPSVYQQNSNYYRNQQQPSKVKTLLTHGAAFGAGALLGSMFHPFGGNGYGGGGFSILPLLLDIVVIVLIVWIVKSIFFRRRY
jgi:hypothetical protein